MATQGGGVGSGGGFTTPPSRAKFGSPEMRGFIDANRAKAEAETRPAPQPDIEPEGKRARMDALLAAVPNSDQWADGDMGVHVRLLMGQVGALTQATRSGIEKHNTLLRDALEEFATVRNGDGQVDAAVVAMANRVGGLEGQVAGLSAGCQLFEANMAEAHRLQTVASENAMNAAEPCTLR